MKCASTLMALSSVVALSCCVEMGPDGKPHHYLRDVRVVRVIPAPWYTGVTATLGKIEVADRSDKPYALYAMDLTSAELPHAPSAGEVCTITYTHYEAVFHWLTGEADATGRVIQVMPGQRVLMIESAMCGANTYDLSRPIKAH